MVYIATLVERDTTSTSKVKKIDTNPLKKEVKPTTSYLALLMIIWNFKGNIIPTFLFAGSL